MKFNDFPLLCLSHHALSPANAPPDLATHLCYTIAPPPNLLARIHSAPHPVHCPHYSQQGISESKPSTAVRFPTLQWPPADFRKSQNPQQRPDSTGTSLTRAAPAALSHCIITFSLHFDLTRLAAYRPSNVPHPSRLQGLCTCSSCPWKALLSPPHCFSLPFRYRPHSCLVRKATPTSHTWSCHPCT